MTSTCLTMNGVVYAYPGSDWRLEAPSLRLGAEGMTCVVGPNGSGKSTLLRLAAGILQPDTGSVKLGAHSLSTLRRKEIARAVGYLPQEAPPLFDYTVEQVVRMGRYAHAAGAGVLSACDHVAIDRAMHAVEVHTYRGRFLSRLSGGERRRALIASVLAQEPDLLLLDEPTNSLDIHHAAAVMRLLSRLHQTGGPAVVAVTHDLNLASLFAERLLLMRDGDICSDGAPAAVLSDAGLAKIYGEDILVLPHPDTRAPMVLPQRVGWGDQPDRGRTS